MSRKALTGPHASAASENQVSGDAEKHTGPRCLFLVMTALLTGQSAGDSSNALNTAAGWAAEGKELEPGGKAGETRLAASPTIGRLGL